jgi:hypothetical protein
MRDWKHKWNYNLPTGAFSSVPTVATPFRTTGPVLETALAFMSLVFFVAFLRPHAPEETNFVPTSVGTFWIYKGTRVEQTQSPKLETTLTERKLSVVDAVQSPGIDAALLKEHVEERDSSNKEKPGTPDTYKMTLVFDKSRYYECGEGVSPETWRSLKAGIASGKKIPEPEQFSLQMQIPSQVGSMWDPESTPGRDDGMYCWTVDSVAKLKAGTDVARFSIPKETNEYTVAFRTCPDDTLRTFVPGVGFTTFRYRHHGTVIDVDEHLAEFHKP